MATASKKITIRPRILYPWKQWTDGRQWTIEQGKDFTVSLPCMASAIYGHARRNKLKATVHRQGKLIKFVFKKEASK